MKETQLSLTWIMELVKNRLASFVIYPLSAKDAV